MVKVKKKMAAMMTRKMGMLHTLLVRSRSARSVRISCRSLWISTSSRISPMKSYFWLMMSDS